MLRGLFRSGEASQQTESKQNTFCSAPQAAGRVLCAQAGELGEAAQTSCRPLYFGLDDIRCRFALEESTGVGV